MEVARALVSDVGAVPEVLHDLAPRKDAFRLAGEEVEQAKLRRRQRDVLAVPYYEVPGRVELEAAAAFVGTRPQVPPRVSARKLAGHRMYRLARRGIEAEAPAAEVRIFSFDVAPTEAAQDWRFAAVVSGGTYVRALVRDLGTALGCGACVSALRRESAGAFTAASAVEVTGDDAADAHHVRHATPTPTTAPRRGR